MRRAIAFCVLALTIAAAVPPAQLRPDFSGEWRPLGGDTTPQQPGAGSPPPPPRTLLVTIAQTSEGLEIGRRVEADGREVVYHFTFRLDGKENVNQMGPLVFYTRASWEGSSLVLASEVAVEDLRLSRTGGAASPNSFRKRLLQSIVKDRRERIEPGFRRMQLVVP
jgi:hypothetical protein